MDFQLWLKIVGPRVEMDIFILHMCESRLAFVLAHFFSWVGCLLAVWVVSPLLIKHSISQHLKNKKSIFFSLVLVSYTRLSHSLSAFLIFWLHLLLFCSLFLRFVLEMHEAMSSIFWKQRKERHYLRGLFLNLCEGSASNTKAFAIVCRKIIRTEFHSGWRESTFKDNAIAWFYSLVRLFLN